MQHRSVNARHALNLPNAGTFRKCANDLNLLVDAQDVRHSRPPNGNKCITIIWRCQEFLCYIIGEMKPALIAAIFLAVVIYLAPRSYGQQAPANGQKESDDQTSLSSGQVHAAAEASHAEHETPHWYKSPEWILVIVGIVTAFFIGRQSWDTRKAAEAALLNAQALINSERARIDGELTQHKIPGTGVVRCSLDVVNQGKTSAKIFGYIIKSRFLTEGADFSKQGMVTLTTVEGYFLIPGNGSRSLRDDFDLDALTANADGIGRTALLITVKYYDVVSEGMERHVRETSLAYIYDRLSATLKRMTEYDEYS